MSWAVCSYYRVSVYVRTANLTNGRGASITLNGLSDDEDEIYGITGIETDTWKQYTIYVKTTAVNVSNVSVTLAMGADQDNAESKGVAFFDKVTVTALSSYKFYNNAPSIDTDTVKTIIIDDGETFLPGGSFSSNSVTEYGTALAGTVKTVNATNGANIYDVTNVRPAIENESTNYVLAITPGYNESDSSYNGGYASVESKDFTERALPVGSTLPTLWVLTESTL